MTDNQNRKFVALNSIPLRAYREELTGNLLASVQKGIGFELSSMRERCEYNSELGFYENTPQLHADMLSAALEARLNIARAANKSSRAGTAVWSFVEIACNGVATEQALRSHVFWQFANFSNKQYRAALRAVLREVVAKKSHYIVERAEELPGGALMPDGGLSPVRYDGSRGSVDAGAILPRRADADELRRRLGMRSDKIVEIVLDENIRRADAVLSEFLN